MNIGEAYDRKSASGGLIMTPIAEAKAERQKEYRITLIATGKSWTTHEKPSVGGEIGILVFTDIGTKTQIHVPRSAVWWCEDLLY